MTRRAALNTLLAGALTRIPARAASPRIVIAAVSTGGAQTAVMNGMQRVFSAKPIACSTYQFPADDAAFQQELKNGSSQLAISLGVDALRAISAAKSRIPLLTTMSFQSDLKNSGILELPDVHVAGAMWMDLSIQQIVTGIRVVFPDISKIAVIRNPKHPESSEKARQAISGVNLRFVDCPGPSDLLPELRRLKGQVECVICMPDSTLYNKTTVEPLILSSLELRLPLIGFSSSFVRAGAALGVYPDFADIGRQTAELAERCLEGAGAIREEWPQRTILAANQRVLHLLGRDLPRKIDDILVIQ